MHKTKIKNKILSLGAALCLLLAATLAPCVSYAATPCYNIDIEFLIDGIYYKYTQPGLYDNNRLYGIVTSTMDNCKTSLPSGIKAGLIDILNSAEGVNTSGSDTEKWERFVELCCCDSDKSLLQTSSGTPYLENVNGRVFTFMGSSGDSGFILTISVYKDGNGNRYTKTDSDSCYLAAIYNANGKMLKCLSPAGLAWADESSGSLPAGASYVQLFCLSSSAAPLRPAVRVAL